MSQFKWIMKWLLIVVAAAILTAVFIDSLSTGVIGALFFIYASAILLLVIYGFASLMMFLLKKPVLRVWESLYIVKLVRSVGNAFVERYLPNWKPPQ